MQTRVIACLVALCLCGMPSGNARAQSIATSNPAGLPRETDELQQHFVSPQRTATPWVYWVWMYTPTNDAAITADLEAMKAKGITGLILYPTGVGRIEKTPAKMVLGDKAWVRQPSEDFKGEYSTDLPFEAPWSPHWRKEVCFAADECHRLGLDFVLSFGLAGAAAPDLPQQYGQQALRWSVTKTSGPREFDGELPLPAGQGINYRRDVVVLAVPEGQALTADNIHNLSSSVGSNGRLRWQVPPGNWVIYRFVQQPTLTNDAFGLFCDALTTKGLDEDWKRTMMTILPEMTATQRAGMIGVEDDSWESGNPNWSDTFEQDFQKRRGYSAIPSLLVLAGETIGDETLTAQIRQDFKQTVSDLIVENYYQHMNDIVSGAHLTLYCEAEGPHLQEADLLTAGSKIPQNMAEFWMPSPHRPTPASRFLARNAANSNHLYGKPITMCEAFTSVGPMFEETPLTLKQCADQAFCDGANRLCIHNYSHSPIIDARPGVLYFAGTYIQRQMTWWDEVPSFFAYVDRCCALLQEGHFVADALIWCGDGIGTLEPRKAEFPTLGEGFDHDRVDHDALINLVSVKDHRLVVPCGMSYRALILPDDSPMTLDSLEKINQLVNSGALVVGPAPSRLAGRPRDGEEARFKELIAQLWGGKVVADKTARQALAAVGVGPDFEYNDLSPHGEIEWIHRATDTAQYYYVASRWLNPEKLICKFRITGYQPELWDPIAGTMRDAVAFSQRDGQTVVPLSFEPCGSYFVVFRKPISATSHGSAASNDPTYTDLATLGGSWSVKFDPKWGGPASPVVFGRLTDWTQRSEPGIKYFSGTAVYTKKFQLPAELHPGDQLVLDLGELHEIAVVKLNGTKLGTVWRHPMRINITPATKPGVNELEISVVNFWPNRLIGDSFLPESQQLTYTNIHHFTRNTPLFPAGLLGPVQILEQHPPATK